MGIVLLATSVLPRPFLGLYRWWKSHAHRPNRVSALPPPHARPCAMPPLPRNPVASRAPRVWQGPVQMPGHGAALPPSRPLRCHTSANGRMVIAGRMADVCAELERMAACEQRH